MFGRIGLVARYRNPKSFSRGVYRFSILFVIVSLISGILVINALADALYALEFDGAGEYVSLGDTGDLMGDPGWTSGKTVSLWLKPGLSAAPATTPTTGELILGVDYPSLFGINRANFNGQDRIWVWNGTATGVAAVGIPYTPDEWMHIALVHADGVLYAYKNGELIGSTGSGTTYAPRNGELYIGGSGRNDASRYLDGQIDEVRIWNTGLGAAEISAWWDQELNGSHPNWANLAAYYKMSDGSGVVLTDDSGNGHAGDLAGGMGDQNWVTSGALDGPGTNPTPTPTVTALPPTATPIDPTATSVPPTATPVGPTATEVPPTDTPIGPTATDVPPTATPIDPTATEIPPTATTLPPTATTEPPLTGSGYALEFDGIGEYVSLGDTGDLMGDPGWTSGKTVSLWLKSGLSAAPATQPTTGEMILGVDYPSLFGINRANFNGQDRIWVWNGSLTGVAAIGIPYTPGEWMHVALVHVNGVLYAYKNGELVGSTGSSTTYAPANGELFIGGSGRNDASRYLDGQIDEIRIWNTGLGAAEISAWWDQELNGSHPNWANLAAYYKMSDGSGVILTDDSGNGHAGDLSGGMGDQNWVTSGALDGSGTNPTPTPTATALPPTTTPVGPTATSVPPTATPIQPTATTLPPTATSVPPTATPLPTFTPTPGSGSGYALEFDGTSDFVKLVETSYIFGPGWEDTKTVSLWVKPIGAGEECRYNDVAFCDTILGDRPKWWGITRGVLGGLDRLWIWNADNSPNSFVDRVGVEYTPDEWVHIAVVHSNGVIWVYKNGVEVGNTVSGTTEQPYTGGLPTLHLGGIIINSRADTTFRGVIDEVKLWNTARTPTQISDGMYQILTGSEAGLRAYYRMSDGSGMVLSDDSIFDWDGTLEDGGRGVFPDGDYPLWVSPGPF